MHEKYLRALLGPLGVYDLSEGTITWAELAALGAGLDQIGQQLVIRLSQDDIQENREIAAGMAVVKETF